MNLSKQLPLVGLLALAGFGGIAFDRIFLSVPSQTQSPTLKSAFVAQHPAAKTSPTAAVPADKTHYYTIQAGDTLAQIARKHETTPQEIENLNDGITRQSLRVGQRLKVPSTLSAAVPVTADDDFFYYTVRRGDTHQDIARKHETTWEEIAEINPGLSRFTSVADGSSERLRVGQRIKIPEFGRLRVALEGVPLSRSQNEISLRFPHSVSWMTLRESLVIEPQVAFTLTPVSHSRAGDTDANENYKSYRILGDFDLDQSYKLTVSKDVITPTGKFRWKKGHAASVFFPCLQFRTLSAASWKDRFRIYADFDHSVDILDVKHFVTCEPKVEFSAQVRSGYDYNYDNDDDNDYPYTRGLSLTGDFQPGTTYTFTFRKGLCAKNGTRLAADVQQAVTIPNRKPLLQFAVQGRYLVPGGALLLPIKTIGISKMKTTVAKIPAHNIVQLAARDSDLYRNFNRPYRSNSISENDSTFNIALAPIVRTNALSTDANRIVKSQLNLRNFITAPSADLDGKGVFLVKIEREGKDNKSSAVRYWDSGDELAQYRLICVSDIGLSAQHSGDSLLIWATSLKTGAPIPDAKLKFYNLNNTVAAEGTTDADGLLTLPYPAATDTASGVSNNTPKTDPPFLLVAITADATGRTTDTTFLPLTNAHTVASTETPYREFLKSGTSEAFVFSDRGIYRHADPIFAQAILRDDQGRAPAPFPIALDIVKPDGKLFKTLPLMPDATGAASPASPIVIGEDQPSGRWTLQLKAPGSSTALGSRSITVESFVPPQIRVAVRDLAPETDPADGVHFSVFSEHLFGRPAEGLATSANVIFVESAFTPKGWEKYRFGDPNHKAATQTVKLSARSLDATGQAKFVAKPAKASRTHAVRVTAGGTVVEHGGHQVSAWASTWLHTVPFYPGARATSAALATPGAPFSISLAAVTSAGPRHTAPAAARATVHSISHVSNFIESRGHYEWRTERVRIPLQAEDITLQPGADTQFAFTPPTSGAYELEITSVNSGATTVFPFYAGTDADKARLQMAESGGVALNIAFEKDSYAPGETVRANLGAPVSGTALITVRGSRTTTAFVRTVKANGGTFEFPVGEDAFPGVDVAVTLVRPAMVEAEWRGRRFYGTKALSVRRPAARLAVKTQSTVTITNGGSTVDVAVHATTPDGKPATDAFATVLLADEAMHILTAEPLPVPADFFETLRRVRLTAYDMFNRLVPLVNAENVLGTDAAPGGDGAGSLLGRINPVKSRRFRPLAQWSADVPVGADGIARAQFRLPEFSGEVRVTAVVRNKESTGSAKEQVKVKPRIVAKADGPRFLAPGDTAQVSLAVYNESGAPGEIIVSASIKNGTGKLDTVRLPLDTGASGSVNLSVTAHEIIGHTTVAFLVFGAGEVHTVEIEFPVRPAAPWETTYLCAPVAAGQAVSFNAPVAFNVALARQSFHVTPNPGVELLPALKFLTHYPYGCVEQTTSSVFPLIAAYGEAGDLLSADPEFNNQSKRNLEAAVQRLGLMLHNDGFSYWPDSRWGNSKYSLYAAHFVVEATHSGAVSADAMKNDVLDSVVTRFCFT